jgi:hypothetical protein
LFRRFLVLLVISTVLTPLGGCGEDSLTEIDHPLDAVFVDLSRRAWYPSTDPTPATTSIWWDTYWYNIEPDYGVLRRDLNPTLSDDKNTLVASLTVELAGAPPGAGEDAWVGLVQGVLGNRDFTQRRYLEIWVNDLTPDPAERAGKIYIDVGRIDENFFEPESGEWHDEDRDKDGYTACLDDSGFDGLFNVVPPCLETHHPGAPDEGGQSEDDDVSGDDYSPYRIDGRFSRVNGTERNQVHDTEDLDRSGTFDRVDRFFRYEIDLAAPAILDIRAEYPSYEGFNRQGHTNDAWRWYRVEIDGGIPFTSDATPPSLDDVRHIRVWFDEIEAATGELPGTSIRALQFCELRFSGHPLGP